MLTKNKNNLLKIFVCIIVALSLFIGVGNSSDFRIQAAHWYYAAGDTITIYSGSGYCSSSCYKLSSYVSGLRYGNNCGSDCTTTGGYVVVNSCSWIYPSSYSYYAYNTVSGYSLSGTCVNGSGNCYKSLGSQTYYGSGSCGSGGCTPLGTFHTNVSACSWVSQQYSYSTTGSATAYSLSGTCASNGTGNCYKSSGTAKSYTAGACGSAGCGTSDYNTGVSSCTWVPQKYSYTRSGSTATAYNFSGATACDANGTGNCYAKSTDYSAWYCGDGSGCGGTTCSTCSGYSGATACNYSTGASQDTVTLTSGSNNLANSDSITFWVYANRTGSFLQFQMGETSVGEQTFNFSINAANTWEQKTWDISTIPVASRDAITKFSFKVTDASVDSTFYFDDLQAVDASPRGPSNCLIGESNNDTFLFPQWIDNSSEESGYQLEKNVNGGGYSFLTNLGAGITGYQDNSITKENTYTYRVRAYTLGVGVTYFSDYCNFPTLDLHTGSLKMDGLKLDGLNIN